VKMGSNALVEPKHVGLGAHSRAWARRAQT